MSARPLPFRLTNAHELSKWEMRGWKLIRPAVPRAYRSLYEGHLGLPGQLWFEDRRLVYETVRSLKPRSCFEIGTASGGGSTLVVCRALRANGYGRLHTIEVDQNAHQQARQAYTRLLPQLGPFVEFHLGDHHQAFRPLVEQSGVDFFLLDGSDDPQETIEQFRFFERWSHSGTAMFAHDWEAEKMRLLRPHLEDSSRWSLTHVVGPPRSVGAAVAVRRT